CREPGHQHQPGWRMVVKVGDDPRPARRTTESPDPLEDRQKRLAGPVVFDALPARDPRTRQRIVLRRQERLEERRLADPCIAGCEHDLAPAREDAAYRGLQRGKLACTPDDGCQGRLAGTVLDGWRCRLRDHLCDEAIATSRYRFDV